MFEYYSLNIKALFELKKFKLFLIIKLNFNFSQFLNIGSTLFSQTIKN